MPGGVEPPPLLARAAALLAAASLGVAMLGAPARAQFVELDTPYVTTPDDVVVAMLALAGVGPSDTLVDLGSGDGRIVIGAARRHGARGVGIEIDPQLVKESRENAQRAGVADRVRFVLQDLFEADLSSATVVTLYLLPDVNLALRPRLLALAPGTRIVSHDWGMGEWAPDEAREVAAPEKTIGLEKVSRLYLWIVPARLSGVWIEPALGGSLALDLEQRYQRLSGAARIGGADYRVGEARVRGTEVTIALERAGAPGGRASFAGRLEAGQLEGILRVGDGPGRAAVLRRRQERPAAE